MLRAETVSKRFGNVTALADVSVDFAPGEIHAVLGENGAGKSTLMNVLGGFLKPDGGRVTLNGSPLPLGDPIGCRALGIEMVHQHFMLVPAFTVAENLALARLGGLGGALDVGKVAQKPLQIARELGWQIEPDARTADLPVGVEQRIEILKALAGNAQVLIFDEPTAVLSPDEVDDLFRVLRKLRDQGKAVILIAHKLSEVMAVADRVTVLRRGVKVAEARIGEVDERQLATWMVGELPDEQRPLLPSAEAVSLSIDRLVVKGDRGETAVQGVTFEVRQGEILGIGGVDGNGQIELAEALALVRPTFDGSIERIAGEIGYIPQDRQVDGLALSMSLSDNLLIGGYPRSQFRIGPFLAPGRVRAWAEGLVHQFRIKVGRLADPVSSLSGGNQQKVVVARTLDAKPAVIIAVNPTRGLDIQAADAVHAELLDAARNGAAVVLFSTDLDELGAIASRTLFMSGGRLAEDFAGALAGEHLDTEGRAPSLSLPRPGRGDLSENEPPTRHLQTSEALGTGVYQPRSNSTSEEHGQVSPLSRDGGGTGRGRGLSNRTDLTSPPTPLLRHNSWRRSSALWAQERGAGPALIAIGLVLALVLTLIAFGLPLGPSLGRIWDGAFGSEAGIARTLVKTTPLLLTGLGIVVAWRAGMYNIGGEGQFVVGGLCGAAFFKLAPGLPPAVLNLGILAATAAGGALYAGVAGWLQVKRGVQVVISTILLNFVALQLLDWSVNGPLKEKKGQLPMTDALPNDAMMMRFNRQTDLHSGVFIALLAALGIYAFIMLTRSGFRLRLVGENPRAARAARIPTDRVQFSAMLLSGALCGLAGGIEYTGIAGRLDLGFSQQWGFLAIPVALLGSLNPLGVVASSLYFGALFAGSENLARFTKSGSTIVYVIQAVAVLGFVGLGAWLKKRQQTRVEPET
ncbi:MAG: ATP-binding cassette domain-containing protein [Fimbriimonadaceae bacterium]|nr:ATP-binding cassette domain-containing protein [Fimbriimonadaceae bacterium]